MGIAYMLKGNYSFKECGNIGEIGDRRLLRSSLSRWGFLRMGVSWATLKWLGTVSYSSDRLTILVRMGIRFERLRQ